MLDIKDKKILQELDQNSRQTISKISKKIKLNKNTTNFRINRLIQEGYVTNFYPVIDISKLGYLAFRVYFKFINTNTIKEKKILSKLSSTKIIGVLAELEASYSVMFMAIVKDISEFELFWEDFKKKHRKYFYDEKISIVTKIIHYKRKYFYLEQKQLNAEINGGSKKENFDEKDIKILSLLSKNCRISVLDISGKLNIPPKTVSFRIKNLEKKQIIKGYRIGINLDKINYSYYKINMKFSNNSKKEDIMEFCSKNKYVIFIDISLSDYDLEIDVEVPNKNTLVSIIEEIKNKYGCIKDSEIMIFKKYYKIESIPL